MATSAAKPGSVAAAKAPHSASTHGAPSAELELEDDAKTSPPVELDEEDEGVSAGPVELDEDEAPASGAITFRAMGAAVVTAWRPGPLDVRVHWAAPSCASAATANVIS